MLDFFIITVGIIFWMILTPPGVWVIAIFWLLSFVWYSFITGNNWHQEILKNIGWSTKLTGYFLMLSITGIVVVRIIMSALGALFSD